VPIWPDTCAARAQGGIGTDDNAQQDDDDEQRLFTVYVHDKPGSPDYEPGDVYFGHRIAQRVEVCGGVSEATRASSPPFRRH
jgi:hypothetical protein